METARKRIRKDFAPLTVSVSLHCQSAGSPVTQVYNAALDQYEPDRSVSPTILQPVVTAAASDGSWPNPYANSQLANMKWYENGVDISTIPAWANKYSIDTVGSTRGALTIYRNLTPTERLSLHFEAELVDNRLGVTHPIVTDEIVLSTVDKSADSYGLSIGESTSMFYNPFLDPLLLYDYKLAQGLRQASAADRAAAAADPNSYLRTIPITVFQGPNKLTSGYTIELYRVTNVNTITKLNAEKEVVAIAASGITLDLRVISKANYMIKALINGTEVARLQFSVERLFQGFSCTPTNDSAILPGQTSRYDQVLVDSEGKAIECPESIISIIWYTDSAHKTAVRHNEGGHTIFELAKTGIGDTSNDDWLEIYTDAIQKNAMAFAVDENGNTLVDENGNPLIFD